MATSTIGDPKHNLNQRYAGVSAPVDPAVGPGALLVQHHNSDKPTFVASFTAAPTADFLALVVESGATRRLRVRRLVITNPGSQTAAGLVQLTIVRTTAASAAGALVTPKAFDKADAAFSGIARTAAVGAVTFGDTIHEIPLWVPAAVGDFVPRVFEFGGGDAMLKDLVCLVGVANGIALRHAGSAGAAGLQGYFEFTEEDA